MGRRRAGHRQQNSPNYEKPEHPYMFMSWNKDLALKMGWITPWPEKNSYRLGSNLIPESYAEYGCASAAHDLMFRPLQTDKPNGFDISTLQYYFHLDENEEQVYLSAECNWRCKNINKAFDHMMGKTAQSFFRVLRRDDEWHSRKSSHRSLARG